MHFRVDIDPRINVDDLYVDVSMYLHRTKNALRYIPFCFQAAVLLAVDTPEERA